MLLVLFTTLFCITDSKSAMCPVPHKPFKQRPGWTFNTKGGHSLPGWCDRVLYLTQGAITIQISDNDNDYDAMSDSAMSESDHDLVMAYYTVESSLNILSVTFNIGDKKKNDMIEKRFNAIMCSLQAKLTVEKWKQISIFHFAFQEAAAWWNKGEKKPLFDFGITLGKVIKKSNTWFGHGIAKYCGDQGALLYVYYNTKQITYHATTKKSWGQFRDANDGSLIKKSFKMLGHFHTQNPTKPYLIVFGTAHLPKKGDNERVTALEAIEKRFTDYNKQLPKIGGKVVPTQNVILILGADTNFRADKTDGKDKLTKYLKTKQELQHWKEIAKPKFKPTCKRFELYKGIPECSNNKNAKLDDHYPECVSDCQKVPTNKNEFYKICTKTFGRPGRKIEPKSKGKIDNGCTKGKSRVFCAKKIPTCDKDQNAEQCLSEVIKKNKKDKIKTACTKYNRVAVPKVNSNNKKVITMYDWKKQKTFTSMFKRMEGVRVLCIKKKPQRTDINAWNYNQPTSSSYYMYFLTILVVLMFVILCTICGLCVGSIFIGGYYYGQQSVNKVKMDEKYP